MRKNTSLNYKLESTSDILKNQEYFTSPETFFGNFADAYSNLNSRVLKLETRQEYSVLDIASYNAMLEGRVTDLQKAISKFREVDDDLYLFIKKKQADFIRCRPIKFPINSYIKWEIECYKYNADKGEKIFFVDYDELDNIFLHYALHDFMIFDSKIAFIHDYDEKGNIRGGWKIIESSSIESLIYLFSLIKEKCIDFRNFKIN